MRKYLISLPHDNDYLSAYFEQERTISIQKISTEYYSSNIISVFWIIECNKEQLSFLVLKGAKIIFII